MSYSGSELPEPPKLTRDMENGWILEDNIRIASFRVKTFQIFVDRLRSIAGAHVADLLLEKMGEAMGEAAMQERKNAIHSDEDLWKAFDRVVSIRGSGRCFGMTRSTKDSETTYVFKMKGTLLSHERRATEPTCHIIRGTIRGWTEAYLNKKASKSVETECASTGSSSCVFEVTFKD